jgi:hypothetical protein
MRADKFATKTGKVTAVVTVMSIYWRKICMLWSANPWNKKPSCHKAASANFLEKNPLEQRNLSQKWRKGQISKKSVSELEKLGLNGTSLKLKHAKSRLICTTKSDSNLSYGQKVKNKTITVLLDSGSSVDTFLL